LFETLTALYVEDEDQIKSITYSLLKNLFKDIYLASDGQEGLDIFLKNKEQIDIIITDINMPK